MTTAGSAAEPGLNASAPLARVHSFHALMPAAPEVKDVPDSPTGSLAASTAEPAAEAAVTLDLPLTSKAAEEYEPYVAPPSCSMLRGPTEIHSAVGFILFTTAVFWAITGFGIGGLRAFFVMILVLLSAYYCYSGLNGPSPTNGTGAVVIDYNRFIVNQRFGRTVIPFATIKAVQVVDDAMARKLWWKFLFPAGVRTMGARSWPCTPSMLRVFYSIGPTDLKT